VTIDVPQRASTRPSVLLVVVASSVLTSYSLSLPFLVSRKRFSFEPFFGDLYQLRFSRPPRAFLPCARAPSSSLRAGRIGYLGRRTLKKSMFLLILYDHIGTDVFAPLSRSLARARSARRTSSLFETSARETAERASRCENTRKNYFNQRCGFVEKKFKER